MIDAEQKESKLTIPSVTFRNGDTDRVDGNIGARFSFAEAMDFCATGDDLVFGESRFDPEAGFVETGDLAPPQAYFDLADNKRLKRQAEGRISWSVMLNPSKSSSVVKENLNDPPTSPSLNAYLLLWRRRSFSQSAFVSRISNVPDKRELGVSRQAEIRELILHKFVPETASIRRGDWVMLINRLPVPDYNAFSQPQLALSRIWEGSRYRAEELGYDRQIAFARVTGTDTKSSQHKITIESTAFEIFPDRIARAPTYVVHLPEVISVHERFVAIDR